MRSLALALAVAAPSVAFGQIAPQLAGWKVDSTTDAMTGDRAVAAVLVADSLIPGKFGPAVMMIRVRCDVKKQDLSATVFTTEAPRDLELAPFHYADVKIKFDEDLVAGWWWSIVETPDGYELRAREKGKEFVDRIAASQRVLVRYTSLWNGQPTVSFTLPSGTETRRAVEIVAAACGVGK